MTQDFYCNSIEKPSIAEFKDRGSKFIAYAFPIASRGAQNRKNEVLFRLKELRGVEVEKF
jgi:hypothetical protein